MKTVSINMLFWTDFDVENRIRNLHIAWDKLKTFVNQVSNDDLKIIPLLFDFSETKTIEDSIHIPYESNTFKKSEKINLSIEYNHLNVKPDLICYIDSDIFFREDEYGKIIDLFMNMDTNVATSNLFLDIIQPRWTINLQNIDTGQLHITNRQTRGLGGFYVADFNTMFNIGGFDERFLIWGGEDDDVVDRLAKGGFTKKYFNHIRLFHLPHATMSIGSTNNPQYDKQCLLIGTNDSVTEHSMITRKYLRNA